ncbi:hypothetical protein VNO80_17009 [Phaseolus coccineus]|uniref:RRM domain-containing protein n=1 Tax=Phaseolus coccineus TaxID=3886 RepID=A0AAN9MSC5_PHACN
MLKLCNCSILSLQPNESSLFRLQFWRYRYLTKPFRCILDFNGVLTHFLVPMAMKNSLIFSIAFPGLVRGLDADDQDHVPGDVVVPGVALQKRTSFLMNLLPSIEARNSGNNLFVRGLPDWVREGDLRRLFATKGKVIDCELVRDRWTNASRGYAFVSMNTRDDATRCITCFNHAFHFDRVIVVERAKRNRGWTPTPGRYCGIRHDRGNLEELRGRRSRSHSPRRRRDRDRFSRHQSPSPKRRQDRYRSRSKTPIRREDRYRSARDGSRYSRDRSRSETTIRREDRYRYSRERRGRSPSPRRHRSRRD